MYYNAFAEKCKRVQPQMQITDIHVYGHTSAPQIHKQFFSSSLVDCDTGSSWGSMCVLSCTWNVKPLIKDWRTKKQARFEGAGRERCAAAPAVITLVVEHGDGRHGDGRHGQTVQHKSAPRIISGLLLLLVFVVVVVVAVEWNRNVVNSVTAARAARGPLPLTLTVSG